MNKVKTFLWVFVAILALIAVGAFAVQSASSKPSEIPTVDTSTAITVTCHEGLTYAITDTAGNEVTEYKQNTDYIITAIGSYGYNVSQIRINDIAQTGTSVTFNTATNEEMTISIIAMPKSIESSDLIVTTNCDYSLTPGPAMYYGNTYTLDANTEDYEGYIISSVLYKGETYSLPYTFILTDLEEKFYLIAIAPYTPEVIATNATYSFTNANEEVVTELVQGTTYTLSAEPNQYYNLQETTFNGEVVTLPYTFVAGEVAEVGISTVGMTVVPTITCSIEYCLIKDLEGNEVTELIYGEQYKIHFKHKYGFGSKIMLNNSQIFNLPYIYRDYEQTTTFTCGASVNVEAKTNYASKVSIIYIHDDNSYIDYTVKYKDTYTMFNNMILYYGDDVKFVPKVNPGYKLLSFTLNGVDYAPTSGDYYKVSSLDTLTFEVKSEKITTSNMTITYTGLPTDYKVYTDIYFYESKDATESSWKFSSSDTSTGTTDNLSEYIDTYSYFTLAVCAIEGGNLSSSYKISSAKLNGSSITFKTNEYGDYVYATKKPFPTTETYTLEITFTAVS